MRAAVCFLLLVSFALPRVCRSQETEPQTESVPKQCVSQDELSQAMERLREDIKEEREQEREELAEAQLFADMEQEEVEDGPRLLRVYGFFDLTFSKYFIEGGFFHFFTPASRSSFMMTNFSLYLDSQMTETLSALAELGFTFLPQGQETQVPVIVGGVEIPDMEYERVDTTLRDPYTLRFRNTGGVSIERLHLTYSPHDAFNILAGRYLTPFGIWNIDHGSPVIITVRSPFILGNNVVPPAQTGLQVFGRFYPTADLFLSYAVTLSNGRGPTEAVYDLDENKGVGMRLSLSYEKPKFSISLGSYGYYGKYTNTAKAVHIDPADLDFDTEITTTEEFDEWIGTLDVLIKISGLRLQSEYAHRRVYYTEHRMMGPEEQMIQTGELNLLDQRYNPSFLGNSAYALIAYELPLHRWIGQFRIAPYFMYEYYEGYDTKANLPMHAYAAGLNLKPYPFTVIKVEWSLATCSDVFGSEKNRINNIAAQLAVSF